MRPITELELRWLQGEAELGNENMRLQYRVKLGDDWTEWRMVPIEKVPVIQR